MNIITFIRAKHNLLFKLLMVVFCSLLLALILPNRAVVGHKAGSFTAVWPYSDLVMEQDLFIAKSEEELKNEKEQIKKNAPVFFELDNREKNLKMSRFEELKNANPALYKTLKPLLDSVYKQGIIEVPDMDMQSRPAFLSNGNYAEPVMYYDFFTIRTAVDFINGALGELKLEQNFVNYLAINHRLSFKNTELFLKARYAQMSVYKNVVRAGQVLVKRGEPLTIKKRFLINSYFNQVNADVKQGTLRFLSKWLLTFLLCMVLLVFLAFFRTGIFGQNKQVAFLFLLLLISVFSTSVFYKYGLMILALPFALVPILVRVFFDGRTALFTYLMIILNCSFFMPDKLEFILLELIPGIGTLFVIAEMRKRQQILNATVLVFVFYVIIFVSYNVGFGTSAMAGKLSSYVPFAISSMLVLLAYPLIYLTEKFFGFISDFRLLELCDLNHPLLRRLSLEVPGTFQHSLQVANLAEEAIYYIGGNPLLVRAGAMYHDIGKMENPYFFTENQANGFSPHQEIEPLESARIIINHVILGVEMAKKHRLPEQIIDFIRTHHGTTSVTYFLHIYKNQGNYQAQDEAKFRYPGPIPFSKETAVLMIADGVEAASRSLKSHDSLTINDLVDNIIDYKIASNQFINSDITFKDITTIKKIFKKRLMNIYHARIEYPS